MSKKIEADVFHGIVVVEEFNEKTRVLSDIKGLSVDNFIDELSRLVYGIIGWDACDEDIQKILKQYYTISGIENNLISPGMNYMNCISEVSAALGRKSGESKVGK